MYKSPSKNSQIFTTYKPIGITPLESLNYLREINPYLSNLKATYVGRLDPMAHGIQLNLINPTKEKIETLKGMDKTYQVLIGLGLESDTYDLLGIASDIEKVSINESLLIKSLKAFEGNYQQSYPPYSAIRVNGKPLHYWANEFKLDQITIPTHPVTVYSISNIKYSSLSIQKLSIFIKIHIKKIKGQFRIDTILNTWKDKLKNSQTDNIFCVSCQIHCSSGTYVRQICHELGKTLKTKALAIEILRTRVGEYHLNDINISENLKSKPSFLLE